MQINKYLEFYKNHFFNSILLQDYNFKLILRSKGFNNS